MMFILPTAALLALSAHVLPAIAFINRPPQASATCDTECRDFIGIFTGCGVDMYSDASLTTSEQRCICSVSTFEYDATVCMVCLGESTDGIDTACAAYSPTSASKTSTRTTAYSTRTSATSRPSATSSTTSDDACLSSDSCVYVQKSLNGCSISSSDIQSMTGSDMACLCAYEDFGPMLGDCLSKCGQSVAGVDSMCSAYASTPTTLATGTATSTARASSTSLGSGSGSGITFDANPTSTSTSTSTSSSSDEDDNTSASGGNGLLSQQGSGGVASFGVPGLVVPALAMAVAAWRVVF